MKICPFMSHMLGADSNVLEIDSPSPRSTGEVVELGYDEGEGSVGVKTERKPGRSATRAKSEPKTSSHLYCLRETCRFYRARDGECTFDTILESVSAQSKAINELNARSDKDKNEKNKKDNSAETVARELDKFWKFQTKSVTELISGFGESEKRQSDAYAKFISDVEKRIIAFMDEEDSRDERMNTIRDGVAEIKDTIDARNDGFDSMTTTVSDLVMSFEDNLKEIKNTWQSLAERLDKFEKVASNMKAIEGIATRVDSVASRIESFDKMTSKIDTVDANVSRTNSNLDRLERNWAELMDVVKASNKKKADDPAAQSRRREAMKFNNLGVTSFHNGDLTLARDQFLEAVNRDDTFAECYNNLGLVYTELGESRPAADAFSKAIKLNPELHAAYNNLGYVFYKQGEYDHAIEMYNEALARSSNNSSAYTNLGNAYFKLGDRKEARKAWEKAIELDPANETAQRSLKNLG
ncbi:MAG: tetratricopeptide repeat protein [Candidatus Krumholzibacteria bacterium]|nr:tetratricopeptide repeat protein [Candidatus Krumholzibacteria bacterium]MDH4337689.1 tetratricopeptide repeat protein [Candidatus Krumholzibacteria bacterium]MDH5269872.1 tetratricopeptide repeat protein [Candidatus Krumholzibacteria bacterium]MDH5626956.1 tetratricopeptide repeat protein [Candidatus Krumholzibacteria bacterium]